MDGFLCRDGDVVLEMILGPQVVLGRTTLSREAAEAAGDNCLKMVEKLRALGRTDFIVGVTGMFDRLSDMEFTAPNINIFRIGEHHPPCLQESVRRGTLHGHFFTVTVLIIISQTLAVVVPGNKALEDVWPGVSEIAMSAARAPNTTTKCNPSSGFE
jgi:hypothetical protein